MSKLKEFLKKKDQPTKELDPQEEFEKAMREAEKMAAEESIVTDDPIEEEKGFEKVKSKFGEASVKAAQMLQSAGDSSIVTNAESKIIGISVGLDCIVHSVRSSMCKFMYASGDPLRDESEEDIERITNINNILSSEDFGAIYGLMHNEEEIAFFKSHTFQFNVLTKDRATFQLLIADEEYLDDFASKNQEIIERAVWYSKLNLRSFEEERMNELCQASEAFKDIVNDYCRKNAMSEIGAPAVKEGLFKVVDGGKKEDGKTIPIHFTLDGEKEYKPSKKLDEKANIFIEQIRTFANKYLPGVEKQFELQSNGSVYMKAMIDGAQIAWVFDPGALCGNDIYLPQLGKKKGHSDPVWMPVSINKMEEVAAKILKDPKYILSEKETEEAEGNLFTQMYLYNYIDLSGEILKLRLIPIEEYKQLGDKLHQVMQCLIQNQGLHARFRLVNYNGPEEFELSSDNHVVYSTEYAVKRISGDVIQVKGNDIIVTNAHVGVVHSYKLVPENVQ